MHHVGLDDSLCKHSYLTPSLSQQLEIDGRNILVTASQLCRSCRLGLQNRVSIARLDMHGAVKLYGHATHFNRPCASWDVLDTDKGCLLISVSLVPADIYQKGQLQLL